MSNPDYPHENWLPVPGFPDYLVSDLGRVRSLPRMRVDRHHAVPDRMLITSIIKGYPRVTLRRDGKPFYRQVHRLVALAFLGPCPEGQEVRHIYGDSTDARLSVIKYGTRAQNIQDCKNHGKFRNGAAHLTEELVREIAESDETSKVLGARYGVSPQTIGGIRAKRWWRHLHLEPKKKSRNKLSDEKVRKILWANATARELAELYGVAAHTIHSIRANRSWMHIPRPEKKIAGR